MEIFEHEIPSGSKLYFKKSAKLKRELENFAAFCFEENGFDEIMTPYFSYHQGDFKDEFLKFSDEKNSIVTLRGDSTIDVVRIIKRRLKDDIQKRWFYIQPVFRYPSEEIYQIGAEMINESDLKICIDIAEKIFKKFNLNPILQISNIEIPRIICKITGLNMEIFEKSKVFEILNSKEIWLQKLERVCEISQIDEILKIVPSELKIPLLDLKNLAQNFQNVVIAPLYYSKMNYYDKLFFRFIEQNQILSSGGNYEIDGQNCSGFAVFSDEIIKKFKEKK